MSLHSKKLVRAAMLLRPQHQRFEKNIHPKHVDRLVKITQEPQPLIYKLHPIPTQPLNHTAFPHPEPL